MAANENYSIKFGQQQMLVEQPVGSGIFSAPCGITGLTRAVDTNTNDVDLPPCDDPDAIIWLGIDPVSKRMTLTFQGTLADVALPVWDDWSMDDSAARMVRWYRNIGAPNQGYWEGLALLTQYTETSTGRGRYTNSGTVIFDGRPDWISIPPAPSLTTPVAIPLTEPEVGTPFAATPGTYTGSPVLTYQWYADGEVITGANSVSYTPVADDEDKVLRVVEIATNVSGSINSQSAVSLPVVAD